MSKGWPLVAMEDIFEVARGGSPRPIDGFFTEDPGGVNWVLISDATESGKYINSTRKRIREEGVKRSRMVKPGDFLLTNSMSFGRPYIMNTSGCIHDGWLVLSPRHQNVSSDFFYHLLGSDFVYAEFVRRAAGATVKNLNIDLVKTVQVPLPPLAEQRRIAEILDRAEALRAKRRSALAQLDTLTQSIFLDMFGDPEANSKNWNVVRLQEVLSAPLRNGLSPSHSGKVTAKVLTLSAITGSQFRADAWKVSTFQATPPADQSVDEDDFLICRGNGNVELVGKGYFPTGKMAEVTFPDTMIAARVRTGRIERAFLQHVWNSPTVRRQITSLARTTNGTFKVNQTMLENVAFIAPSLALQCEFARRVAAIGKLRVAHHDSLAKLDSLFACLQDRAFSGELSVASARTSTAT